MQRNENGEIALKYLRQGGQRLVYGYVFVPRANIRLAWVKEVDVPKMLQVKHGCCGGTKKQVIFPANESDVRRWENNGGR